MSPKMTIREKIRYAEKIVKEFDMSRRQHKATTDAMSKFAVEEFGFPQNLAHNADIVRNRLQGFLEGFWAAQEEKKNGPSD